MKLLRLLVPAALLASAAVATLACDTEDPTSVVIDNDYPTVPDGGDPNTAVVVYKAWWFTTDLTDAVAPASEGSSQRTVPGTDYAYVVLAPGWDPASSDPPTKLVALKSVAPFHASRGDILHIHVNDTSFTGNCAAGHALAQADADFITTRIFPGEFDGTYDAATCAFTPNTDGGDAGTADASDAGTADAADASGE